MEGSQEKSLYFKMTFRNINTINGCSYLILHSSLKCNMYKNIDMKKHRPVMKAGCFHIQTGR